MANWKAADPAKGIRPINHLQFTDDLKLYGATKDQFGLSKRSGFPLRTSRCNLGWKSVCLGNEKRKES